MARKFKTLSVVLAAASLAVQPALATQPEKAWQLYQNSAFSMGGGTTIVTLGKKELKIFSPTLEIFLAGPGHPASIYGTQAKQYLQQPYEEWKKKFGMDEKKTALTRVYEKTNKFDKIAGFKVQELDRYVLDGKGKKLTRVYWMTTEIPLEKGVQDSVRGLSGLLPGDEGIPLRVYEWTKSGKKRQLILDTLKISRVPVTAATFKRPTGYTKAASEMSLLLSGKDDQLNDLYSQNDLKTH